jgi:hypothetical protein
MLERLIGCGLVIKIHSPDASCAGLFATFLFLFASEKGVESWKRGPGLKPLVFAWFSQG